MNDHILRGFKDEIEKTALLPALALGAAGLGAAGLYGAYSIAQREKKKRKAVKRMITGQYQPGAGMIVPPRSY